MPCAGCRHFGGAVPPGSVAGVVFAPGACPLVGLRLLRACWPGQPAKPCRAAVGCPEEPSTAGCRVPAVLARRSHRQPLTVPDRTVDVRLCTERRARREGEGETSAEQRGSEFQINLLLCWCLTRGAPAPQRNARHGPGAGVIYRQLRRGVGQRRPAGAESVSPVLGPSLAVLGTRGWLVPWAVLGPADGGKGAQWVPPGLAGLAASLRVLQSALLPLALRDGSSGLPSGRRVCSTRVFTPRKLLRCQSLDFSSLIFSC